MSEGGSIAAGIEIGRMIRLRGWNTAIPPGTTCASACALAWLGGIRRLMWPSSKVGFHASHTLRDGVPQEHGASNAAVGAYLNQLGLSDAAINYITSTAPASMKWLTPEDAKRYGIAHKMMEDKPSPVPTPTATAPMNWLLHIVVPGCVPPYSGTWETCKPRPAQKYATQDECNVMMTTWNRSEKTKTTGYAACVYVGGAAGYGYKPGEK
jgi:hypothetical protein